VEFVEPAGLGEGKTDQLVPLPISANVRVEEGCEEVEEEPTAIQNAALTHDTRTRSLPNAFGGFGFETADQIGDVSPAAETGATSVGTRPTARTTPALRRRTTLFTLARTVITLPYERDDTQG
jgi:hypothetical protein